MENMTSNQGVQIPTTTCETAMAHRKKAKTQQQAINNVERWQHETKWPSQGTEPIRFDWPLAGGAGSASPAERTWSSCSLESFSERSHSFCLMSSSPCSRERAISAWIGIRSEFVTSVQRNTHGKIAKKKYMATQTSTQTLH